MVWPFNVVKKRKETEAVVEAQQNVIDLEIERNKAVRAEASKKISKAAAMVAQKVSHVDS